MAQGAWVEAEPGLDVKAEVAASMAVFAVGLPQPLLEVLRERAAAASLPTGALIRQWLEERAAAGEADADQQLVVKARSLAPQLLELVALFADSTTVR